MRPFDYSTERLLYAKAREVAELRELLVAVAQELERLVSRHPQVAKGARDADCAVGSTRPSD